MTILSDAADHRVQEVVNRLQAKLEEIRRASPRASSEHIALLASLNLAETLCQLEEELLETKQELAFLKTSVRERSQSMLATVDVVTRELERASQMEAV